MYGCRKINNMYVSDGGGRDLIITRNPESAALDEKRAPTRQVLIGSFFLALFRLSGGKGGRGEQAVMRRENYI